MNAEDALVAKRDVERLGDKGRKDDDCRGQKRECLDHWASDGGKRKDDKTPKMVKFTP